ncbi:hypothetical protein [Flavobacterium sp. DSP2-3-1]|uniref:hypothetical protein n=1 Tax=Flavobacterium sp. DSP2-3-1 TaxID=2804620 RepID=UPI003CFBA0A0
MLKLYTDNQYITPANRRIVFPLLFDLCYTNNLKLLEKYQMVSHIDDCDIVVVPVDIIHFIESNKKEWLYAFIDTALGLQKKVWVYTAGDFGYSINKSVFTFRMSGFNSKFDSNTFILPSFIEDPYTRIQKEFRPIVKTLLPKVGFVGHASPSASKWIKEALLYLFHNYKRVTKQRYTDYQPFYPSSIKRYQFLSLLQKSDQIGTHFIFRNQYRAGVKTEADKNKTTLAFFENIEANPYTFCLRGAGNYSVRFYETLAMGRIPFVVDTDFRLPLEGIVNWKKHCIIVSGKNLRDALIEFHQKISHEDFEKMQTNNRNLWLNHLNREAYFTTIYSVFKEKV